MSPQNYENYWQITNAFTNYNGDKFLSALRTCVEFIDENFNSGYTTEKYLLLQLKVQKTLQISAPSVRKSINQLVKFGFINTFLESYHPNSKDYLNAESQKERETILSKIIYSNSSFNRSVTETSHIKEINFLIKTLINKGSLKKEEIIALMLIDIEGHEKDFADFKDLNFYTEKTKEIKFNDRKYNQIGYLNNLLGKLDNLTFVKDVLYFKSDADQIIKDESDNETKKRDSYLHKLYKNQLINESESIYGGSKCVLEKLTYPVLIASHIKPFIDSNSSEEYNPNNGLLLSRTADSLFDLGYISFKDNGCIIFSKQVSKDVSETWKKYSLDNKILNNERKRFLSYHRENKLRN